MNDEPAAPASAAHDIGADPDASDDRRSTTPPLCCFDFDGLLVDTARLWTRAYEEACAASGGMASRIDLVALRGASVPAAAIALSEQIGMPVDSAQVLRSLTAAFRSETLCAIPGVEVLLDALAGTTTLTVVTNGPERLVEETLMVLGLHHHFSAIVSADRVTRPKPAPDVYLAACREMGVRPAEAVAFEDSAAGVQAARTAGLRIVGVPPDGDPLPADLVAGRLDDSEVLSYLGLR